MEDSLSHNSRYSSYWSVVSKAVEQILQNTPATRVSFEEMYGIVYKSVCDGFSERMYVDLLGQCSRHLEHVDHTLHSYKQDFSEQQFQERGITKFIMFFHEALASYSSAVQQITPIFAYMNKFYVEVTLQTSLQAQLLDLFRHNIADSRVDTIMRSIEDLLERPFVLSPAAMSLLFRNLHCIGRGDYGRQYPKLFSRYVPGILPPMAESDIAAHIAETRELQSNLLAQGESGATQQGHKRRGDDDNYGPTLCVSPASQLMSPLPPDV